MDRELDPFYRKKIIIKRSIFGLAAVVVAVLFFSYVFGLIKPSVKRSRIRTSVVENGMVRETFTSSGTVIPEFEQVISCPVNTKVLKVLKQPGDYLYPGEKLLELDINETLLALNRLDERISLQKNQKERLRVDLARVLNDQESQLEILRLQKESAIAVHDQENRLFEMGGTSKEKLRRAKMERDIAEIKVRQQEQAIENSNMSTKTQLEGLDLEIGLLRRDRQDVQRQIELSETKAEREGVLTWIVEEEGSSLREGETIARVADLSSFRIEAQVSDIHSSRLRTGIPILVSINEENNLQGSISSVLPTIENGIVTFMVKLEDKSNDLLRSNMRVDVYVVTAQKESVLRVSRGPFAQGEGIHDVFVIRDDKAYRTRVRFGISSFDYYEVVEGLNLGDEVIISDMSEYIRLNELGIK